MVAIVWEHNQSNITNQEEVTNRFASGLKANELCSEIYRQRLAAA